MAEKIPYMLKRNWITEAVDRGIFFEMNYSQALDG